MAKTKNRATVPTGTNSGTQAPTGTNSPNPPPLPGTGPQSPSVLPEWWGNPKKYAAYAAKRQRDIEEIKFRLARLEG